MEKTGGDRPVGKRRTLVARKKQICDSLFDFSGSDDEFEAEVVRLCEGDKALEREVRHFFGSETDDSFLESPLTRLGRSEVDALVGRTAGKFKLVEVIGEGGMGVVYRGERTEAFEHTVAVKVLKRGKPGSEVFQRFLDERRVLAKLAHPHIGRLFDGGDVDGRPFIAMEWIEGVPLDEYCREKGLSVTDRLDLFLKVCGAVSFAHFRLIVHRDIKPSNILVTEQGAPKLLDFGIAKSLDPEVEESHSTTRMGAHPMTPAYASPEQIRLEDITVASDVYSLGVVLYELLTGVMPYSFGGKSYGEIVQAICDVNPTRPSSAVVRSGDRDNELTVPAFGRLLRGDLDLIVMKALRKEPERRYLSVEQMADDVRRHLSNRPVLAREPELAYVVGKFIRRNMVLVSGVSALVIFALIFGISMFIQSERVRRERDIASEERDRAKSAVSFLVDMFKGADPRVARGEEVSVKEALYEGAGRIRSDFQFDGKLQGLLLQGVGEVLGSLGDFAESERALKEALLKIENSYGSGSVEYSLALFRLGEMERYRFNYGKAVGYYQNVDQSLLPGTVMSEFLCGVGDAYLGIGDVNDGLVLVRQALEALDFTGTVNERNVNCVEVLAFLIEESGDIDRAVGIFESLAKWYQANGGDRDPGFARITGELGKIALEQSRLEEADTKLSLAVKTLREVYGRDNIYVARYLRELAYLRRGLGDSDEAIELFEEILTLHGNLGGEHSVVGLARHDLAGLVGRRGDLTRALELEQVALEDFRRLLGEHHLYTGSALNGLGRIYHRLGRLEEAQGAVREAVEVFSKVTSGDSIELGTSLVLLSRISVELGVPECRLSGEQGVEVMRSAAGTSHVLTGNALVVLARCCHLSGDRQSAAGYLEEAEAIAVSSGRTDLMSRVKGAKEALGSGR